MDISTSSNQDSKVQSDSVQDQAQHWFITLQGDPDNPELLQQFQQWLQQSPEHEDYYLEVCLLWQDMELAAGQLHEEMHHSNETCHTSGSEESAHFGKTSDRAAVSGDNPISISANNKTATSSEAGSTYIPATPRHSGLSSRIVTPLLSITMLMILIVMLLPPYIWHTPDHYTQSGEKLSLSLDDGSTIHLNSQSAVNIDYSASQRRVELIYGEAFFEVASDKERPFSVSSQGVVATALGTAFNVRQLEQEIQTTLTEGRLRISTLRSDNRHQPDITLTPGQRVTIAGPGQMTLTEGHKLYLPDWKRNVLRLDNTPLSDVLALLNRQYSAHLVLVNPELQDKPMNGVIPLNDLPVTLELLSNSLNTRTVRISDRIIFLH